VYYGATYIESQLCGDEDVIVVAAGTPPVKLLSFCRKRAQGLHAGALRRTGGDDVPLLDPADLGESAIELHFNTEIVSMDGHTHLERVDWLDKSTGQTSTHQIHHVFIWQGIPRTTWLRGCVAMDDKGFILTDEIWMGSPRPARQPLGRFRGLPDAGDQSSGRICGG